jgi:inosine-uridine nucleoside N-ribohydrolase
VDDIEAITYLAGSKNAYVAGVVTTHMIPDRRANIARAVMHHLGDRKNKVPIGVGSVYPIGKEDETLVKYLREHTIKGKSYEGDGLIECFPSGVDLIHRLIKKHGSDLSIAVLAPMTDLAKAVQKDPANFARIGGLYIQGQAKVGMDGKLAPDPAAYNLKEDMKAAEVVFGLQNKVPLESAIRHAQRNPQQVDQTTQLQLYLLALKEGKGFTFSRGT